MFNTFDKNIIFNIFEKLDSWSVLSACMISTRSNRLCKDKDVIRRLLEAQYPEACYTDNPWKQYVALASNVYTFYELAENTFREDTFWQWSGVTALTGSHRSVRVPDDPADVQGKAVIDEIWVHGTPVPIGEKLWIMYFDTELIKVMSFKTKESLANWIVRDRYKIQLEALERHFLRRKYSAVHLIQNEAFIAMMRAYRTHNGNPIDEACIPFTKENYHKLIMNSKSIDMFYNWDSIYIDHVQF